MTGGQASSLLEPVVPAYQPYMTPVQKRRTRATFRGHFNAGVLTKVNQNPYGVLNGGTGIVPCQRGVDEQVKMFRAAQEPLHHMQKKSIEPRG